jgi:hypothetical protein
MAKTGDAYLRAALYRLALVGVQHTRSSATTTRASVPRGNPR